MMTSEEKYDYLNKNWQYDTICDDQLLKVALNGMEEGLHKMFNEPTIKLDNYRDEVPGFSLFNLSHSIIDGFLDQNPDFEPIFVEEGRFTAQELETLKGVHSTKVTLQYLAERRKLKRHR
jgi:hypothetical protein